MGIKITNYIFNEILNSLDENGKNLVKRLHEQAISLGYVSKISAMGKKADDWKCEYIRNKNVLYILRITNDQWFIRCKLFNISKYNNILEKCNDHCIEILLKNSAGCGNHGGRCKGPIDFSIKGMKYSKCRRSFTLKDLIDKDIDDINKLLEYENYFVEKK
ncbi:MAG: hypothetical protein LBC53_09920 [Spirochaetaceae bacterium]|jgi:hypothetical protein|nr:hypothetical protein [Spirochaetaceae bacterium]